MPKCCCSRLSALLTLPFPLLSSVSLVLKHLPAILPKTSGDKLDPQFNLSVLPFLALMSLIFIRRGGRTSVEADRVRRLVSQTFVFDRLSTRSNGKLRTRALRHSP